MRATLRIIGLASVLAVVAGCQIAGAPQPEATHKRSMTGFATLAGEGTFDHELAPVRTRLAKLSYNVDRLAKADRIQSATASQVRGRVQLAGKLLDDADAAAKAGDTARARDQLKWARAAVEDGEAKLSGAR